MSELLPDEWRFQEEEPGRCCAKKPAARKGPVTDIVLWTECYASLIAVLTSRYPHKAPAFMAYLRTIVKAQRSYYGDSWVSYDMAYRRRAAYEKSLDWDRVDFTLFNETFTGRAKILSRCRFCLSELHVSGDCHYAPASEGVRGESAKGARRPGGDGRNNTVQLCNLFNSKGGDQCRYKRCRYTHFCVHCLGQHPASECGRENNPAAKRRAP